MNKDTKPTIKPPFALHQGRIEFLTFNESEVRIMLERAIMYMADRDHEKNLNVHDVVEKIITGQIT